MRDSQGPDAAVNRVPKHTDFYVVSVKDALRTVDKTSETFGPAERQEAFRHRR